MIAEAKYTSFGESREPPESSAPSPLDYPQWVAWRYEKRAGAKPSKPAYSPITTKKTSFSPEELCSYERALAFGPKEGVGCRLTETDPFTAIDLDHCVNPETGEISPRALEIIEALDSYTEISPSGTGVRVFVLAVKPEGFGQNKRDGIEVYDRDQYVTYTGSVIGERSVVRKRQQAVEDLCEKHLPRKDGGESRAVRVSSGFSSAFASAATTP